MKVLDGKIAPNRGALCIRAYCTTCNKLLQQSTMMSKKQLRTAWDRAVLGAIGIECKDCGHKFPNFEIELKIYNMRTKQQVEPATYIKLPRKRERPEDLFRDISRKWLKDHPGCEEVKPEEVAAAVNEVREESLEGQNTKSKEQILKEELEKRNKYYGSGQNEQV